MTRTKLFRSNRSQAVRLPKDVAFPEGVRDVNSCARASGGWSCQRTRFGMIFSTRPASICRRANSRRLKSATRSDVALSVGHQSVHTCLATIDRRGLREIFNREADGLATSTIVLTELLHGAAKSARPEANRREVESFAARLEVLPL